MYYPDKASNAIPFQFGTTASSDLLIKALALTVLLLAACYLILWLGRRYGLIRGNSRKVQRELEIIESIRISGHTLLHALRYRNRVLIIAESSRNVFVHVPETNEQDYESDSSESPAKTGSHGSRESSHAT